MNFAISLSRVLTVIHNYVLLALATPVQFWIGWRFYRGLWDGIKAKASNMDTLIAVGTSAAYFYSAIITILPAGSFHYGNVYFETAAIIITLILIGRLLEFRTKEKASNAVRKLLDLQPRMAHVIRKQEQGKEFEVELPIEEVLVEDILVIRPGEMIPTDGKIIEGSSSLDESAITGESIPVDKTVGHDVIGGTMNRSGLMKVIATKVGQDTVLSQILTLVQEARTGKAPMQRMADQVAKYFVPAVILIAISAGLGWYFVGVIGVREIHKLTTNSFQISFYKEYDDQSDRSVWRWNPKIIPASLSDNASLVFFDLCIDALSSTKNTVIIN